jgi:hypothetical protein
MGGELRGGVTLFDTAVISLSTMRTDGQMGTSGVRADGRSRTIADSRERDGRGAVCRAQIGGRDTRTARVGRR